MSLISYGYSGLVFAGGLYGFNQGSKASLIAGSLVALANAGAAYAYQKDPSNKAAFYTQLGLAAFMSFKGGKTFLVKGSAVMGVIGVASFLRTVQLLM